MDIPAQIKKLIEKTSRQYPNHSKNIQIYVSIRAQTLYLIEGNTVLKDYIISSALNGTGNLSGSFKTPIGIHTISEKIGHDAVYGSIFRTRKDTHTQAEILTKVNEESPNDIITSRILWLSGLEEGINKGGNVDTHDRYIYIHGTDEEGRLGKPVSHGCIRMGNKDVIALFNCVNVGTLVTIFE